MNVLDLFSGIGGFSLGLERAGMRTVAFCEIEPYCRAILRKHWPGVPCYDDVRTLTASRLRADGIVPDIICGGFPCQDISVSGSGLGLAGKRSGLWNEYARLIGEIQPRYVIVENVAAITFRGLLDVLGDFTRMGYDTEWRTIRARDAGAPHGRKRLWLVAYVASVGFPPAWELCNTRLETPGSFAEADRLVAAFQASALPYVCRGHDGASPKLDELAIASLGNSVIPQITLSIGQAIMAGRAP